MTDALLRLVVLVAGFEVIILLGLLIVREVTK